MTLSATGTTELSLRVVDPLHRLDAKLGLESGNLPLLPHPPAHLRAPAVYEETSDPGGTSNIGVELYREDPSRRISTMIAGNSGRPGGATGNADGTICKLHAGHSTQEEDMISNWMVSACRSAGVPVGDDVRGHPYASRIYRSTIAGRWGMSHPEEPDFETVQGVDYTCAKGSEYGDAWCVDDARLSAKIRVGDEKRFDTFSQFPTSLVFVAGPNAGTEGRGPNSTTLRTYNKLANEDYGLFREGVRAALHAGLLASAQMGCSVALLAHVSAGIYAGPHKARLKAEYEEIVNEVLTDARQQPAPLGHYFERVILTLLEKP